MSRLRCTVWREDWIRFVSTHFHDQPFISPCCTWIAAVVIVFSLVAPSPHASAQGSYADTHAMPVLPDMLARGDAGVARPDLYVSALINPAQLGAAWGNAPRFTVLGVTASGRPGRISDAIDLFEDELADIEERTDEEVDEVERQALDLFRRPLTLRSAVLLPSAAFRAGRVGMSAGAFVTQTARAQAIPGGVSPDIAVFGQTDGIVAVGAGVPIGMTGLRAGLTTRYVRRYVSTYRQRVEDYDVPPVLSGSTIAVDLGVQYDIAQVKGLTAGLAVYDLVGGNISYDQDDFFGAFDDEPEPGSVERAQSLLDDYDGPSMRLGLAYVIPRRYMPRMGDTTVLLDWSTASTTGARQSVFRRLRLGTDTKAGPLQFRAGLSQGLPTVGVGIDGRVVYIDYAIYGRQEGIIPEDGSTYAHAVQIRFGW
ncbi:hypothetical protein CRI94_13445 [Longibacter salinarum]|uniref:DUF5723 domain-containing protein n=1 Tax=Longibacter salinarum TaxID=1850348 RepID=A0A2A8CV49_9BACT|nr:hypothetical protein [Longibacter salinarum]PEN12526.1 hypothetical protein CRI94_13445 [Longibacter salinarum]